MGPRFQETLRHRDAVIAHGFTEEKQQKGNRGRQPGSRPPLFIRCAELPNTPLLRVVPAGKGSGGVGSGKEGVF